MSKISDIRRAVADYMSSEGCSCCQDIEARWRGLRRYLRSVKVMSCADGSFRIEAKWQPMYAHQAGAFTRLSAATRMQALLNARLKGKS